MKSFAIKFNENSYYIAEDFDFCVFLYYRFGNYYIEIDGIKDNCAYKWLSQKANKGDNVEISYVDIEPGLLSNPIDNYIPFLDVPLNDGDKKLMYSEELIKFRALEKLLRSENLIP
jgi:hypothetical protein